MPQNIEPQKTPYDYVVCSFEGEEIGHLVSSLEVESVGYTQILEVVRCALRALLEAQSPVEPK